MGFLRGRLLRNLGNIGSKRMYTKLRDGTKILIEEYQSEVCDEHLHSFVLPQ